MTISWRGICRVSLLLGVLGSVFWFPLVFVGFLIVFTVWLLGLFFMSFLDDDIWDGGGEE